MASLAKRAAAAEAAKVDARHASAARTPNPPISVHLTPYAPGCSGLPIQHPRRWKTFWGQPRGEVVRKTLDRIRLAPGAARAERQGREDVCLLGPVPAERLAQAEAGQMEMVPFAIFFDGLSAADLSAELAALQAQGWRPQALAEARP